MKPKAQVNLGDSECFENNGVVLHELVHLLGAVHEQNRPDRDDYIEIIEENLLPGADKTMKIRSNYDETYESIYDFQSVMHYPADQACLDDTTCMRIKEPYRSMFQRNNIEVLKEYPSVLSSVDIYEISSAYNCSVRHSVMKKYNHYQKMILTAQTCTNVAGTYDAVPKDSVRPECNMYNILSRDERRSSNSLRGYLNCDNRGPTPVTNRENISEQRDISPDWKGEGWYRFQNPAGTLLAQSPSGTFRCGADATGWSNSTLPDKFGDSKRIIICFDASYASGNPNDCFGSQGGKVTNCGSYYVYYLHNTPSCSWGYCGNN